MPVEEKRRVEEGLEKGMHPTFYLKLASIILYFCLHL